tara:strand:+ start:932 stop:1288 length:357 start_codon:yes stop_codon:yes gene_type:complete
MEYILIKQEQSPGRNGTTVWRLTFYCIDDGTEWEMLCDNTYDNFKRSGWNHVCQNDDSYGVYANLKRTDRKTRAGIPIVNADSRAQLIYRCQDQAEALALVAADLEGRAPTNFRDLFV